MITCGTLVTKARRITVEIAKVLKTVILPWTAMFLVLQILRAFSIS